MIYKVKVQAHITIPYEETISVFARNEKEARAMAREGFKEIVEEKYENVYYECTHIEECVKCQ